MSSLDTLARRVHDVAGRHSELYIDARVLGEISGLVHALPCVTIDHLGMHADGLGHLLRAVESGARVKATGFGRVDLDPATVMTAVLDVNPAALMVGTDLPSTRARRPSSHRRSTPGAGRCRPRTLSAIGATPAAAATEVRGR